MDINNCLGHNPVVCGKCIEKCKKHCIDFDMNDEEMTFKVGTIIVATGMEAYDPTEMDEYGYTRLRERAHVAWSSNVSSMPAGRPRARSFD